MSIKKTSVLALDKQVNRFKLLAIPDNCRTNYCYPAGENLGCTSLDFSKTCLAYMPNLVNLLSYYGIIDLKVLGVKILWRQRLTDY